MVLRLLASLIGIAIVLSPVIIVIYLHFQDMKAVRDDESLSDEDRAMFGEKRSELRESYKLKYGLAFLGSVFIIVFGLFAWRKMKQG
jgi:hypothetical protein